MCKRTQIYRRKDKRMLLATETIPGEGRWSWEVQPWNARTRLYELRIKIKMICKKDEDKEQYYNTTAACPYYRAALSSCSVRELSRASSKA